MGITAKTTLYFSVQRPYEFFLLKVLAFCFPIYLPGRQYQCFLRY